MTCFILFLDIDGVLHACNMLVPGVSLDEAAQMPLHTFVRLAEERGMFPTPAESLFARLPALEAVIRPHAAQCDLVIALPWRQDLQRYKELREAFSPDIRTRLVGTTPVAAKAGDRPGEVAAWLSALPDSDALPIVISDGSQDWKPLKDQVVLLNCVPFGFGDQEGWLLEALLALTPVQLARLKPSLSAFNSGSPVAMLRKLYDIAVFDDVPLPWPCFADFEATGLASTSHPIEIAWTYPTGESKSYLIEPDYSVWRPHWDPVAEAIHGISQSMLARWGEPAVNICSELNAQLDGLKLYFDGGHWDRWWLKQLYKSAGFPPTFEFADFDDLMRPLERNDPTLRARVLERLHREAFDHLKHRAYWDAMKLQRWYLHAQILAQAGES